jgi:transcriptional regulator with XRE-family HTH domain
MQFANTVQERLAAKGWSLRKFGDEIGRTPEHARKLSTGRAFPSDDLVHRIADKLEIEHEKLQRLLEADRWEKKYKRKPPESARPDLAPIQGVWQELSKDQRVFLVCVAKCLKTKKRG